VLVPLLLAGAVLLGSLIKTDLVRNDFERFDDLRLTFFFFAVLASACAAYTMLCLERPRLSIVAVRTGAFAATVLLLASFPVGSKDVFLYSLFGKLWTTYHVNPYSVAPAFFATDPWQPFAPVIWAKQPAPYGPLFLWQSGAVALAAAGHLFVAVWLHKLIAAAAFVLAVEVGGQIIGAAAAERPVRLALLAYNPLLLFESAANAHGDAVMGLLVLVAVWMQRLRGPRRWLAAPAALAAAIWYKWYALLWVPLFAIDVYRERGLGDAIYWTLATVVLIAVSGVVLFAPFADALPLVAQRLLAHENLRQIFPLQLSPPLAVLLRTVNACSLSLFWFDVLRLALFALIAVVVITCQWRSTISLAGAACLLSTAFVMLVVTVLWPWHLFVPVALALVAEGRPWQVVALVLTVLGLLSYFFTFVWAAIAIAAVAGSVGVLRSRKAWARR
jgi:hypothetical protein